MSINVLPEKKPVECSFSFDHYRHILATALESGYQFCSFGEGSKQDGQVCVLRHDIDYTSERILEYAQIESDLGIKSYYFFLLNCPTYNIREKRNFDIIQRLKKMGHYIGTHFDLSWEPNATWDQVVTRFLYEKKLFEMMTEVVPCEIVSFHNPHKFKDLVLNKTVAGIEHTYEQRYFSDMKYLSDSQGWYEGCVCKVFAEKRYKKIQLLTHPYIWSHTPQSNFIGDMAEMLREVSDYATEQLIEGHPVCYRSKEELRRLTTFPKIPG